MVRYIENKKMFFRKIKEDNNKIYISKINKNTAKKVVKKLNKNGIKNIVCDKEIMKSEEFKNYIYSNKINISNNKKKCLRRKEIIINIDFPEELINKYNIYEKAIIINIEENI